MGWKDDKNLDPWNLPKVDFNSLDPGPWKFRKTAADIRYNEGTFISDSSNPIFVPPEAPHDPVPEIHSPCGYWINEYTQGIILTTPPYPIEATEKIGADDFGVVSGFFELDFVIKDFDNQESVYASSHDLVGGVLRLALHSATPVESLVSTGSSVVSGHFNITLHNISYTESLQDEITLASGILRKALITYDHGLPESLTATSALVIGGSHGV
jgi:hypothetical protein